MKGQLRVAGYKLRVISIKKFLLPILLVTCYSLLVTTANAGIRSKAAIVMDSSTGRILYGKNPNLKLPPASITKLMTAMVALDRLKLGDTVSISERAASVSPTKANLRAGEKVTVETLLHAALIKSANDAAFALAEAVADSEERFVEVMNQKAIAIGISDTRFINSTGLPGEGQHTTAYDLARMMRHSLRYPLIKEIINTKAIRISTEDGRTIFLKNSNRLLWSDESVLGGKTGYTREAKHCFVCAIEQNNDMVIVALLGSPSRETLWKESEDLMEKGFAILNGREEPVMYFSRSDYKESVRPASYSKKTSEVKRVSYKKTDKKTAKKKAKKTKSAHVKKHKGQRNNTAMEINASSGHKG